MIFPNPGNVHVEGTWPHTKAWLRSALADVARRIGPVYGELG